MTSPDAGTPPEAGCEGMPVLPVVPQLALAIAIPAHDEAVLLPRCLTALAHQRNAPDFAVLVYANNCTDGTAALARGMARRLPFRLIVEEALLAPQNRNAGHARRRAMERAATLSAKPDFLLLATDADAQPADDWVLRMQAHFRAGADAVAGRIVIEAGTLPPSVRLRSRKEAYLARLHDRIASLLDPVPWDPWPRHAGHWGANFGVTVDAFHRAGGIPPVPVAEDRAFFRALERVNARIRHAEDSRVLVSARTEGRAAGGMADVLRRRSATEDPWCDAALEPLCHGLRRMRLRQALRTDPTRLRAARIARRLGLDPQAVGPLLAPGDFGETWERLLQASPALRECRLAITRLDRQTVLAARLLRRLGVEPPEPLVEESLV
ncbi:glycosyltransferase [Sediminicoccus sp. BL-A-41-H5]|uniref:glycosyltransferase n=1 Tax=Sediminicoccus sp. BL-A-41-H5 TaxID=3421106 RepID=UPI003D664B97